MAGFTVDTEAVRSLGHSIARICDQLSGASRPPDVTEAQAGSRDVSGALSDFHTHSASAQSTLIENLSKLAKAIDDSADAYASSDQTIATSAQPSGKPT